MPHLRIPSSKTYLAGNEIEYVTQVITSGNINSDSKFTRACARLLEDQFGIHRVLMTTSCTAALEMATALCDLNPRDEVVLPSFTFSSTANAVLRAGAKPVFVDIRQDTLNIDEALIEKSISPRTKAIIPVHYAGVACRMDRILEIAAKYNLNIIEDAAQGVNSFWRGRALGSIGDLGTFSFHSTKNYACGEGGALCINSPDLVERAEIIRDKGTNRSQFLRKEVDRYTWVEVGSSYVPSEMICAFLLSQLEMMEWSTGRRREVHRRYDDQLRHLEDDGLIELPFLPADSDSNYHIYYLLVADPLIRNRLLAFLNSNGIGATSHFQPLHSSPMGQRLGYSGNELPVTQSISGRLVRLPIYPQLSAREQKYITSKITEYLTQNIRRSSGRRTRATTR